MLEEMVAIEWGDDEAGVALGGRHNGPCLKGERYGPSNFVVAATLARSPLDHNQRVAKFPQNKGQSGFPGKA